MSSVWIVTDGRSSDYHICGVFESKQMAEEHIARALSGYCDYPGIEEWPLNDMRTIPPGMTPYEVIIAVYDENVNEVEIAEDLTASGLRVSGKYLYITVIATDEQHAIKIASERRRELIAMNIVTPGGV